MTIMVVAPGHALHTKRFIQILLSQGHRVIAVCEQNPLPEARNGFSFIRPLLHVPAMLFLLAVFQWLSEKIFGRSMGFRFRICLAGLLMKCTWLRVKPDLVYQLWVDSMANICLIGGLRPLVLQVWGSLTGIFCKGQILMIVNIVAKHCQEQTL